MNEADGANRRGHFRLRYPPGAGPALVWAGRTFAVVELSERGLRIPDGGHVPLLAERMAAVLRFTCGTELTVAGTVARVVGGWIVLRLTRGVSLSWMLAEQRRILRDYPGFLRPIQAE